MDGDLPWESFDYKVDSSTTSTTRVEFTEAFVVNVGDQHVSVHVADQDQSPDYLTETRHTGRIDVADIISYAGVEDGLRRVSYAVSVDHDKDGVALTDDAIGALLASVSLPECTWDNVLISEERLHGVDFNGDDVIATIEDLLAD
jgi:hypothetical protein